ncbi:hypothetical protein GXW78_15385 [Roseomonas terrae]|jgi:protein-tyrosine kinase|uniref:Uncharacterized protein n=1 Tax=Neoroseomonas terrae TaxID=424799 RepID=A0ABS5EJ56_9PROT|nr:hypothetical protein [Neoroseomonas terrae]MBR0651055.1 hypothetical protein [Neoroseomonas terrae]
MTGRAHLVERAVEALHEAEERPTGARAAIAPDPIAPPPPAPAPAPASPEGDTRPVVSQAELEHAGLLPRPRGEGRSRLAEEIELVRHQLLRGIPALPPGDPRCARVVMVTSAAPGEGKTFTSLNVAAAIAEGVAAPVLLIDADGRRGSLGEMLGLGGTPGLRALAASPSLAPATLLCRTAIPRLSVLTNDGLPGAGEAPGADALAAAVRQIAAAFPDHLIILDMPPALAAADAGAMAPIAGQIVLVVLAEKTQRNEVEAALDVIEACPDIRLLLNRAGLTVNDSFGAHGAYNGQPSPEAA